jgi:tRNA uridine 5-carboxymethylaminomethyl modification enzyme
MPRRFDRLPLLLYSARMNAEFDVIVIGGGHAGCEAAAAAARMRRAYGAGHASMSGHDRRDVVQPGDRRSGQGAPRARGRCAGRDHCPRGGRGGDPSPDAERQQRRKAVQGPRMCRPTGCCSSAAVHERLDCVYPPSREIDRAERRPMLLDFDEAGQRVSGVQLWPTEAAAFGAGRSCWRPAPSSAESCFAAKENFTGGRDRVSAAATALGERMRALRSAHWDGSRPGTPAAPRRRGRSTGRRWRSRGQTAEDWTMSPTSARGRVNPQLSCAITRTNARHP